MSFERMQDREDKIFHEKVGVMLYNFTPAEVKQLMLVSKLVGIREVILLKPEQGEQIIRHILDGEQDASCVDAPKDKSIIFNGIPGNKMNVFIEMMKKYRIKRPLIAVVTEYSIEWQLKALIASLIQEKIDIAQNKVGLHNN